ncbi:TlpA family protein disulfide reductase [Bacteroidota bacterium]|jgi:thiol-disulfide isomerase/thioredoxin
MKVSRKTILNILFMAFVLSFFVTPLGYYGKILLNQIFSFRPEVIEVGEQQQISDYNWKLKNASWEFFNFEKSKGNVVFINFWASWRLPCAAELKSIQNLYDKYKNKVDFYIITDEERLPVEEFMKENKFTFPVTYLIIGERSPLTILEPPSSYIIDKEGNIRVKQKGIADWDNNTIYNLLNELTK